MNKDRTHRAQRRKLLSGSYIPDFRHTYAPGAYPPRCHDKRVMARRKAEATRKGRRTY